MNFDAVKDPASINWVIRKAKITDEKGKVQFEMDVEAPDFWSDTAVSIVSNKYFKRMDGVQETSVKHLLDRVVITISDWGVKDQYFSANERAKFESHLLNTLVTQSASFNSPVYFNVGATKHPRVSACFIVSVEDHMDSILNWYVIEGKIFQDGSGSGINLSSLRAEGESLSGGGTASGPLSFMKAADESAGAIKSGGRTRRAAKFIGLNADHPDVEKFIECKVHEERLARTLLNAGWSDSMDGPIYQALHYQNANNSVRVTDEFMHAVENDQDWNLINRTDKSVNKTVKAKALFKSIAKAAWECGDPGLQFDTTINKWHTRPKSGRIEAANPCLEYLSLNNSACNLASINLLKFVNEEKFDIDRFISIIQLMITAMDLMIDNSSFPTELITKNAKENRELGLGYANLGALLMYWGIPYDSEEGRNFAAAITSLLSSTAYVQSALLAKERGSYKNFELNKEDHLTVIRMHREMSNKLLSNNVIIQNIIAKADKLWEQAEELGNLYGYRNAQVVTCAPTGTIAFMMDCDTTGVEPDIAPVKFKKLVGGGRLNIVNQTVPPALKRLGYSDTQIKELLTYVEQYETFVGSRLKEEHLPIFDCANGVRSISPMGHVKMVASIQPFVSGGISKTCNLPNSATVEDIESIYLQAWKLGIKSIAVYRDGSKWTQPLNGAKIDKKVEVAESKPTPIRRRLPEDRSAHVHKMEIAGWEGYIHAGYHEDGSPAELFIKGSKAGSAVSGLLDSLSIVTSLALQHGVPLRTIADKMVDMRFEPSGITRNGKIRFAQSIVDYVFRWMLQKFENEPIHANGNGKVIEYTSSIASDGLETSEFTSVVVMSEQTCTKCEGILIRTGSCYTCRSCGESVGSCG